jgi:hypothetical protein
MSGVGVGSLPLANWTVAQTGDFDGDSQSDILWYGSNVALWLMNGGTITSALGVGTLPTDWQIQNARHEEAGPEVPDQLLALADEAIE